MKQLTSGMLHRGFFGGKFILNLGNFILFLTFKLIVFINKIYTFQVHLVILGMGRDLDIQISFLGVPFIFFQAIQVYIFSVYLYS